MLTFARFNSTLYAIIYFITIIVSKKIDVDKTRDIFTIQTDGCVIPGYPLISESIRNFVGPPQNGRECSETIPLVKSNSSHVWVDKEAFSYYGLWNEDFFYCCYKHFAADTNIKNIIYEECIEFSTSLLVEHEFVRIECYFQDNKIYDDFFLFNFVEKMYSSDFDKEAYNVLILGFESVSRLNFHRTMPLTSKFLKDKGIIEMYGYNKLGDNSFPNLFPMLTGKSFDYVKKTCVNSYTRSFDTEECKFIWDKFKERGYITALGSDSPAALLDQYEFWFPVIPTHIYIQPFISETIHISTNKNYNYHECMGSRYYYKIVLDYIYDLTYKLSFNNLFAMFWEESVSHEHLNEPHIMDENYHTFFTSLINNGYLDKTILVILSDHGMRWGPIVLTDQGRSETQLPYLGFLFPKDFKNRYKLAFKNIKENSNRLITPLDVHETLIHLINKHSLTNGNIKKRSNMNASVHHEKSLFLPISGKRTCESIGIEKHWCACYRGRKIKPGPKMKPLVSQILVKYINDILQKYEQCSKLRLENILHVSLIESNKSWRTYMVIVQTTPGDGIFDGTLIKTQKTWKISGIVSRLNLYRNQSFCVTDNLAKMYCFCKTL